MRWKKFVGGLALGLTAVTGCKQPIFMTEGDYQNTLTAVALPKDLEENPRHGSITPDLAGKITPAPADVLNPDRPVRFLTLSEAIKQALENGTIGLQAGSGQSNDAGAFGAPISARGLQFGAIDQDSIRVQALNPANIATDIEAALSRFDAHWVSSMTWNTTDRPVGTALDVFQAQATNAIRTQAAELSSTLLKPLPTGGVAGITFDTQYQLTNLPARVNPSYTPSVTFQFEQPLLQGFGVDVNQIRADPIVSALSPQAQFGVRNAGEGILLTRIRYDQARADFELNVQNMLLNVEVAYWNLYAAYGQLYAQEIGLRKNLEIWNLTRQRVEAGLKGNTLAEFYDAQGKYETSRSQWLGALGAVLEAERNLRGLMGLKPEDGTRLVPSDPPTLAPFRPDWETALQEALVLKPELAILREQIKAGQLHLIDLKNKTLPDLRFTSQYGINGIGTRLDGPDQNNALRDLSSDHFNNWALGLQLNVALGYRDANAGLRLGRIQLAQAYWSLRTAEDKVSRQLALQYRHISEFQGQMQRNLASAEAYNGELNVRFQQVRAGVATLDITLLSIQFGTQALAQYYQFVGQYNAALANFEYQKGTLLQRDNVVIADGPLPECAQVQAVEHKEERDKALDLREVAAPAPCAAPGCAPAAGPAPDGGSFSLPDWIKSRPPLPPEVNNPPAPLPPPAPKTLDQMSATTSRPSLPTVPAPPPTSAASSSGKVQPLSFPEDRKVPASLPPLPPLPTPDLGNGPR
jgi:outer membrane protein TolC